MAKPVYKRILLKLSGETFQGDSADPVSFDTISSFCEEVAEVHQTGVQIGLVVGGGNIFRGVGGEDVGLDRASGDYMGMLATVINALALQTVFDKMDVPTRVLTAIEMRPLAEPYIRRRALRHLAKGRVVIFGAGTGNPFFTTDTAAALRANEIGAEVLFKATKVDGVYDKDPVANPDAVRFDELSYTTALARNLRVMDATAISLCRESNLPILVFNLRERGSIMKAVLGESTGTIVRGE